MQITLLQVIILIIICALSVCGVIFVITLISVLIDQKRSVQKNPCKKDFLGTLIAFRTFKSFYDIDPSRWVLRSDYVDYITPNKDGCYCRTNTDSFYFSDKDWVLYKKWKVSEEERREREEKLKFDSEAMERLTSGVKESLEKFKKEGVKGE